ncbi:unnamed protein product [Didymodactylos carnosus]|uniref:Uncharacterized protein n=1 Tax=Didymodactylos carnosus TaxID=1234261 RepID=A0A814CAH4_9BILA|nr:unnamed protein product [Didymodactylos carnosus]CAF3716030.1 unnamed protein product [Didymodactylos carnosus]
MLDDSLEPFATINITIQNLTYCHSNQQWIQLEIKYILYNDMYDFIEQLDPQTTAYISYAQDIDILHSYCQYHNIPLISTSEYLTSKQDMCSTKHNKKITLIFQLRYGKLNIF